MSIRLLALTYAGLVLSCLGGCCYVTPVSLADAHLLPMAPVTIEGRNFDNPIYIFAKGDKKKPPVLLLHELPGLNQETLDYARELSHYFTVYAPRLFGETGQNCLPPGALSYAFNGDWRRRTVNGVETQRITAWLREVIARIEEEHPTQAVGIIGMCVTGDIPLALAAIGKGGTAPNVRAVVLAQPALPLRGTFSHCLFGAGSLGISEEEYNKAIELVKKGTLKVYATRFRKDTVACRQKFERLKKELANGFCDGEIDNDRDDLIPEGPGGVPRGEPKGHVIPAGAHSVLIGQYNPYDPDDPAQFRRDEVVRFLMNQEDLPPRRGSLCRKVVW